MKKFIISILLVLFLASPLWGATYYVASSSAGNGLGGDYDNRSSQAYFEAGSGVFGALDGDTVYITGSISSQLDIPDGGTSGSRVVIRGDYGGHECTITVSGNNHGIRMQDKDYVTVQGFIITGAENGIRVNSSTYFTAIQNTIYLCWQKGIFIDDGSDYATIGGSSVNGNEIYDCGQDSGGTDVVINWSDESTVSYNKLYATAGNPTYGTDGIALLYSSGSLIEYNTIYSHNDSTYPYGEDGIDLKQNVNDVIIRYNHIYDHQYQTGITVQMGSYNIQIYGNNIHGNKWGGVYIKRGSEGNHNMYNIDVWGNLIWENGAGVIIHSTGDMPGTLTDVGIYNNTLAENGFWNGNSTSRAGVCILYGSGHIVKNNVFYKNHGIYSAAPGEINTYQQVYTYSTSAATFGNNLYYYPGRDQDDDFAWMSSTARDLAEWNDYAWVSGELEDDVEMTDEDNQNYTLVVGSPCIDSGEGLGASYDDALNPLTTDHTDVPPTVAMVDQDAWGDGWEIGAFAYPTSGITVTVTTTDATAAEEGTTTGEYTIACSPNCAGETINWSMSGTAIIDTDYNLDDETGATEITGASTTITLTPVDDGDIDPGEVAIITVLVGTGYAVGGDNEASIEITDNDSAEPGEAGAAGITITSDASGSGKITYTPDASGSGRWTR